MTILVIGCLGTDLRLSLFDWRARSGMGGLNDGGQTAAYLTYKTNLNKLKVLNVHIAVKILAIVSAL